MKEEFVGSLYLLIGPVKTLSWVGAGTEMWTHYLPATASSRLVVLAAAQLKTIILFFSSSIIQIMRQGGVGECGGGVNNRFWAPFQCVAVCYCSTQEWLSDHFVELMCSLATSHFMLVSPQSRLALFSVHVSVCVCSLYLYIYLFIYIYLSVYLSVCLSICLFVYLPICI